jgi:hypothetical protein
MAEIRTITVDLDDIKTRATAVSQIKLNKTTTPNEVMVETLATLSRAIAECRLAEMALTVEGQRRDQEMVDAGYGDGDLVGGEAINRQIAQFRTFADGFAKRIVAIERLLDARSEAQE